MEDTDFPPYSIFNGYADYFFCFPPTEIAWTVIGTIFWAITFSSYVNQIYELVAQRSSYGINGIFMFSQFCCNFFLVYNMICLKWHDFIAIFQYTPAQIYIRFLTFLNLCSQFIIYTPIMFLTIIYHDTAVRDNRGEKAIKRERILNLILGCSGVAFCIIMLAVWAKLGQTEGFDCKKIEIIGEVSGVCSIVILLFQYIPEYIEVIKLKDNGSLSLLSLIMQGTTDLINALFMWFGQHEDLTTFGSALFESFLEFTLIVICIFFKIRKRIVSKPDRNLEMLSTKILGDLSPVELPDVMKYNQ